MPIITPRRQPIPLPCPLPRIDRDSNPPHPSSSINSAPPARVRVPTQSLQQHPFIQSPSRRPTSSFSSRGGSLSRECERRRGSGREREKGKGAIVGCCVCAVLVRVCVGADCASVCVCVGGLIGGIAVCQQSTTAISTAVDTVR